MRDLGLYTHTNSFIIKEKRNKTEEADSNVNICNGANINKAEPVFFYDNMKCVRLRQEQATGITLIALVITIIFQYDKLKKCSDNNDFLLSSI